VKPSGYSGTPLPEKLGVKPGAKVMLVNAPDGFEATLGDVPPGATLVRNGNGKRDLTLVFIRTKAELVRRSAAIAKACKQGPVWVCWPKRSSPMFRDVTENMLRDVLLPLDIVDTKVCAIDEDWSGLRFSVRQA
jgi:hypothetical protein